MSDNEPAISQEELRLIAEVEGALSAILKELRVKIARGRRYENGDIALNYAALVSPYPRIVLDLSKMPENSETTDIPGHGFELLKILLLDEDVKKLRRAGDFARARRLRRINRIVYRRLLGLYNDHTTTVLNRDIVAIMCSTKNTGSVDIIGDTIYFRFSMIKMRLAAYGHLLHLSGAAKMVVNTMRGIDFLLNRIAPLPPTWNM
jgi:hypothetical protein